MATPQPDTYSVAAGVRTVRMGVGSTGGGGGDGSILPDPPTGQWTNVFSAVTAEGLGTNSTAGLPQTASDQVMQLQLHGSGGRTTILTVGTVFRGDCVAGETWNVNNLQRWAASNGGNTPLYPGGATKSVYRLSPQDIVSGMPNEGGGVSESYWMGIVNAPAATLNLYTERRLDAMIAWVRANVPEISKTRWVCTGSSMGAWGGWTYAVRRPQWFAAVYGNAPRWRYHGSSGDSVWLCNWLQGFSPSAYPIASAPALSTQDGGGSSAAHVDMIAYVSNTANKVPWIGWSIGIQDGYGPWADQVAAIAALRAAKRGFAVTWNNGTHGSNPNLDSGIKSSYPEGLWQVGRGYPLFTQHSLDGDPAVDLVGGINLGLTFRNVVESSSGWSCQVTNLVAACTVRVEPISQFFTTPVSPVLVTIPSAGTWVSVSF